MAKNVKSSAPMSANYYDGSSSGTSSSDASSRAKKTPLELLEEEELKKRQYASALASPIKLEGPCRELPDGVYFDLVPAHSINKAIVSNDHGTLESIAVHLRYIALGTSIGDVLVFPCKYSLKEGHTIDSKKMEKISFATECDEPPTRVTSLCFNEQGNTLLCGYANGLIAVCKLLNMVTVFTRKHEAEVIHTSFLGEDSLVKYKYKAISCDCQGSLQLLEIDVRMLYNFTIISQCLDGHGTVLCAAQLPPFAGLKLYPGMAQDGVAIFVSKQKVMAVRVPHTFPSSCIATLSEDQKEKPSLEVFAEFSKLEGMREDALPYSALVVPLSDIMNPEAVETVCMLAIAWDRKVQVAKLVNCMIDVCAEWDVDSQAIGLTCITDGYMQMLAILTMALELCLFTMDGRPIQRVSSGDGIACQTCLIDVLGNPQTSFHNSLACLGSSIYSIAPEHVSVYRLLTLQERVNTLCDAGNLLAALKMAMSRDFYAEDELPISSLESLLVSYVEGVFDVLVIRSYVSGDEAPSDSEIGLELSYAAGVAFEVCNYMRRLEVLEDILSIYRVRNYEDTFFETLEPYILKGFIMKLPTQIIQDLLNNYIAKGWLERVEQCVLHVDISSLDIHQVIMFCRENALYSVLIYAFTKGLDDYRTPLEDLLSILRDHERDYAAVGFHILLYLKYCFAGLAFPPGHGAIPYERLPSLRTELLQFLLDDGGSRSQGDNSSVESSNLLFLLQFDTEATLDVLGVAILEDERLVSAQSLGETAGNQNELESIFREYTMLAQKTVSALFLLLGDACSDIVDFAGKNDTGMGLWPSEKDLGHLIEFLAVYVAFKNDATVPPSVGRKMLKYLFSDNYLPKNESCIVNGFKDRKEKTLLGLMKKVQQTQWDASYFLSYLRMLCAYEPHSVLSFLQASDNYDLAECWDICEQYEVLDAAIFLYKRGGYSDLEVLERIQSDMNYLFCWLAISVENLVSVTNVDFAAASKIAEVEDIESRLRLSLDICHSCEKEEFESLWLRLLDSFFDALAHSSSVAELDVKDVDRVLKMLHCHFVEEIARVMKGSDFKLSVMSKFLCGIRNHDFGDFKQTIRSMISSCESDIQYLKVGRDWLISDAFRSANVLKKHVSKGISIKENACCICDNSLGVNISNRGLRVFYCGHWTHRDCENKSGMSIECATWGCPMCVINRKAKDEVKERGLVTSCSSSQASNVPPNRFELSESTRDPNQGSRYTDTMPQLSLAPANRPGYDQCSRSRANKSEPHRPVKVDKLWNRTGSAIAGLWSRWTSSTTSTGMPATRTSPPARLSENIEVMTNDVERSNEMDFVRT